MKNDFWIPISLSDPEETNRRLEKGLAACQWLHEFVIEYYNGYWERYITFPKYKDTRVEIAKFIKRTRLGEQAQRYSLDRCAEKAHLYFAKQPLKNATVKPETINSLQIKSRVAWRRYLAKGYGLTTGYGTLYLEGDWKATLRAQAEEIEIDLFPYLWNGLTIKKNEESWSVLFHFHPEETKQSRRAKRELKKEYKDYA